ncbi:tyrosine-protein phosphatase non-receptor type 14-like isoform X2 [Mizuhopecten yessoensis]|uniref:tyrosine-protein phosphatase non-receptor type 14-like isoform X2 n=1 Tax=Mizuhopecten yessoensis TaxID=6573 RepID=UPI000B4594FD|nr:tyrosine-protein phosphatase non-receptor type 14-like isoform X2 [Mizuhopecten yessoensis]
MPFGLRFKRTRRYEVSSKNVFVVGVSMLDNSFLECTLNSDSTGQECLDSIAQRIELAETQYFGLRYVTKKLQFHWVDLTKPLKKQIDKNAQAATAPRLYFGVMFYIPGAHRITDDAARYNYFLQLKMDIVEGRIPIVLDQVVRLAAFCLQAEFGDHDYDKNAQDYFKDNNLFPKTMCKDDTVMAEMMNETLSGYISLQGVHPFKAEMQYIKEIQMMDGYGMEYYTAKDEKGKELYLGTSYLGIFARYLDAQPAIFFRWSEIARLTQSKKTVEVDTSKSSCQYHMEDSETAKYFRRLGSLQQKFYRANKGTPRDLQQSMPTPADFSDQLTQSQTSLTYSQHSHQSQQSQDTRFEQELSQSTASEDYYRQSQQSLETTGSHELPQQQQPHVFPDGGVMMNGRMYSPIMQHQPLHPPQTPPQPPRMDPSYASRAAALPAYRPSPSYDTVMRQRVNQPQQIQNNTQMYGQQQQGETISYSSQQGETISYTGQQGETISYTGQPGETISYTGQQGETISYTGQQGETMQFSGQPSEGLQYTGQQGDGMSFPHQHVTSEMSQYGPPENDYVNSTTIQNYSNSTMYANVFQEEKANYLQQYRPESNLIMQTTYSTPELNSQGQLPQYSTDNGLNEPLPFQYKPPPPYPRASSSSPDLAVQTSRANNIGDSPDLVSRKNLGMSALALQSNLDKSVENLADVVPKQGQNVVMDPTRLDTTTQIAIDQVELNEGSSPVDNDDASSDHSGATFHARDTDSEVEDGGGDRTLKREGSKSQIQIKYVAPSKAPPPSTSKEVVTRRESFRRMMIARTTGQLNPPALCGEEQAGASGAIGSNVKSENDVIPEQADIDLDALKLEKAKVDRNLSFQSKLERKTSIQSSLERNRLSQTKGQSTLERKSSSQSKGQSTLERKSSSQSKGQSTLERKASNQSKGQSTLERKSSNQSKLQSTLERKASNQSKVERTSSIQSHSSSVSGGSSVSMTERSSPGGDPDSFLSLSFVPPVGNYMREETVKKIKELTEREEEFNKDYLSDSDPEEEGIKRRIGPLKMAALNGLTLSRPMVLALMNDESRAPKDERRKLLETKLSENLVFKEFEEIPKKVPSMECQSAKLTENESRNRFRDVLPYDSTRVKISPRKDNPSGYINASHVKLPVDDRVWWYIATQAPMSNTAVDFWQMVWEQEVDVIAMLTAVVELGKRKCYEYWPQEIGPEHKIIFGQFEVTLMFCNDSLCYVTNRISVVHLPTKKERQLWHLQYTDWPDHGCPEDMYGFLGFLDEVESVQRLAESEEGSGKKLPILVHCSAGVGRTGVVILTQVMKWCLEHNHDIDLQKALGSIRQQRMYLVQTVGQYNFIHKTLIQYLKNTRLI